MDWLVATCPSNQIAVPFLRRDPTLEYDPTLAFHGEQVAIPSWCCGVVGQGAVGAVVVDELL